MQSLLFSLYYRRKNYKPHANYKVLFSFETWLFENWQIPLVFWLQGIVLLLHSAVLLKLLIQYLNCTVRKRTIGYSVSMPFFRAVSSDFSLDVFWIAKGAISSFGQRRLWTDCAVWFESSLDAYATWYVAAHFVEI